MGEYYYYIALLKISKAIEGHRRRFKRLYFRAYIYMGKALKRLLRAFKGFIKITALFSETRPEGL